MQLYVGTSTQFNEDVFAGSISHKLERAFFDHFRYKPGPGEVRSWQNSGTRMSMVLQKADLTDHGVIREHQLPLSSKRLDCMVLGQHGRGAGPGSCRRAEAVVEDRGQRRRSLRRDLLRRARAPSSTTRGATSDTRKGVTSTAAYLSAIRGSPATVRKKRPTTFRPTGSAASCVRPLRWYPNLVAGRCAREG